MERGKSGMSYEDFLRETKYSIDTEGECQQNYYKYLIMLSAGSLGLSITFIDRIAPHPKHLWLMCVAWGLLLVSLTSVLFSFLAATIGCKVEQDIIRRIYYQQSTEGLPANRPAGAASILVSLSAVAFVLGIGFLLAFSMCNLTSRSHTVQSEMLGNASVVAAQRETHTVNRSQRPVDPRQPISAPAGSVHEGVEDRGR